MILFLLPRFSGGGAERVTLNLLTELHNRGHSVGIIVFDASGPLMSILSDNIPIYNLGTLKLRHSIVSLVKKIRELNPKVVFSTLGYVNVTLLAISWLLPTKIEIWIREANLPSIGLPNNAHPKIMTTLYKLLYKKSDKLICTSKRMRSEFISDFFVPENMIKVLPNPVDVGVIRRFALPLKRFDKGGVCYVAAGRLVFQKGFDRLLLWFSELKDKNSTLTILGKGDLKDELIRESELLNIRNRVKFLGFCDNPWQWYAGADVFLLPSRWEGMPNSVLEALACGTPVIATEESGGIKEIVEQSEDNSVITVIKSQQFVQAMKEVKIKNKGFELKSLLPERYRKENVINIFEGWLNELK
jgi:glycosyltransferase involved in cell wall biosynthesis